ncbi:MAG: HU family DNA-binding protein [Bryobacterales bacterium]
MAKKAAKKAAKASTGPMTQTQIINYLAEQSEVNKKVVKGLLDSLGELAVSQTKKNGKFVYPGLGRLVKSQRKARTGRNPATGEAIKIPAKTVVKFRLSKAVSDQIVPPKPKK